MAHRIVGTGGPRRWSSTCDTEGHKEYSITTRVEVPVGHGPQTARQTPGLFQPGDIWYFPGDKDVNIWATCQQNDRVTQVEEDGTNRFFDIEQYFTTRGTSKRCKDVSIEDPLMIPDEVSGGFNKFQEEATKDRFGCPILSKSFEMLRGPQVEFDRSRPTLQIKQFVPDLQFPFLVEMIDTVNAFPIWGFSARCVKLSMISWSKKYYGQCYIYYERNLEFEFNTDTWDRDILSEGHKALNGEFNANTGNWEDKPIGKDGTQPNPLNPSHFSRYKDRNGENTTVIHDCDGRPADVLLGTAVAGTGWDQGYLVGTSTHLEPGCPDPLGDTNACRIHVEYYEESDFFALGVPINAFDFTGPRIGTG